MADRHSLGQIGRERRQLISSPYGPAATYQKNLAGWIVIARRALRGVWSGFFLKERPMRSRSGKGISSMVVSIIVVGTSLAGDAVPSGLKPGESVSPFDVEDVTGPNKGRTLCYR
jgi:hypothetical protein